MANVAEPELTIVLTGFGPFGLHNSNPSEKVVRRIAEEGIEDIQSNARIIVKVMPVAYDDVQDIVSELWEKYHPDLVVHLGVHSVNHAIRIETGSCGIGYYQDDIKSQTPEDYKCPLANSSSNEEGNIICTGLDCMKLVEAVRMEFAEESVQFELSNDPGRYLCAYSYYISLQHDKNCSLFVHIPCFNKSCTLELVTKIVKKIVQSSIQQVLKARKKKSESLYGSGRQQPQTITNCL
uniref:Pyroglutamyl-peptidase 1 n=1 Tax=Elaeophora elaphi TaxID=1147741 RepID=A0A0R3RFM7_9BILA